MGGSGGYRFSSKMTGSEKLREKIKESQDSESLNEYHRETETLLNTLLTKFNNRDTEQINKHLETIKAALNKEIDGAIDIKFGGSVGKNTYTAGLSDIDSLILLNNTNLEKMSPNDAKNYLYDRLRERFPKTEIRKGDLAVTLQFHKHEIQLLPAVKTGDSYKISSPDNNKWSTIKPKEFARNLTKSNIENHNKTIPIIKLAKAIMSSFNENKKMTGYHIEAVATEAFKNYKGSYNKSEMLTHLFDRASKIVKSPIKDITKQSYYVDEYLGKANSIERKRISDNLARVSRKMKNADATSNIRTWNELFEK